MVFLLLTAASRRRRPTNLSESVTGYNKGIIAAARRKCDCKGAAETARHIATVRPRRLAARLCYERTMSSSVTITGALHPMIATIHRKAAVPGASPPCRSRCVCAADGRHAQRVWIRRDAGGGSHQVHGTDGGARAGTDPRARGIHPERDEGFRRARRRRRYRHRRPPRLRQGLRRAQQERRRGGRSADRVPDRLRRQGLPGHHHGHRGRPRQVSLGRPRRRSRSGLCAQGPLGDARIPDVRPARAALEPAALRQRHAWEYSAATRPR